GRVALVQPFNEQVDNPLRLDRRAGESDAHLLLDIEATGNAADHRIVLAPPVRHFLKQGGDETQRGTSPEIGNADHVEHHEPAALGPCPAAQHAYEVRLADAGLAEEHPTR